MFENVKFQTRAVQAVMVALTRGLMAPAWLIHGPAASAKLTLALEWARGITCRDGTPGLWSCTCESCQAHRLLNSPNLVLGGAKDFAGEIQLSARALLAKNDLPRRFHFFRAIRKTLKRMDPLFWDGGETKYKTLESQAETLAEMLELLDPTREPLPLKDLEKIVSDASETATKMAEGFPASGLSVDAARNLATWARNTGALGNRVIIIESAERLLESARNALLKILEEPPPGVVFLLLTRHRGAIIPTILSRLRSLEMAERNPELMAKVVAQVFGLEEDTPLAALLAGSGRAGEVRDAARGFWLAAREKRPPAARWDLGEEDFHPFLEELTQVLREEVKSMGLEQWDQHRSALDGIQEAVVAREVYNLETGPVLDQLYLRLRDAS